MTSSPTSAPTEVVLVMPCLNEAQNLMQTCHSLGFGSNIDETPESSSLIIVDNGSTDGTPEIAEQLQRASPRDRVHLVKETERGFVPARHRGNLLARRLSQSAEWDLHNVLILQVDADCEYQPGYIAAMKRAAESQQTNVMIEACVDYPAEFKLRQDQYVRICDQTDTEFEKLFPRILSHDDIVVDAVSGYRLADYFNWGGHQREFTSAEDEIYAETTRMFMRARTKGAERFRVNAGMALHSARKALENPALHMATAGFPREDSWNKQWVQNYRGPTNIWDLSAQRDHPEVQRVIRTREEHLLGLMGLLPLHVDRALGQAADNNIGIDVLSAKILPLLPLRTLSDVSSHPGVLITDVFDLIATHGSELLAQARQAMDKTSR
jgi:glycosyltransferase involved in cell wall biosynthesis